MRYLSRRCLKLARQVMRAPRELWAWETALDLGFKP